MNETFQLKTMAQSISRDMKMQFGKERQRLDRMQEVLPKGTTALLQKRLRECDSLEGKLRLLSPENVLRRGYSITLKDGKAVTRAEDLRPGDRIVNRFHHGETASIVE